MSLKIPRSLDEILETALLTKATRVSLEYDSSGDLEVTYFTGISGVGFAITNAADRERVIAEVIERAGLETKEKGTIRTRANDGLRVIRVSQRDHFGELAFDLRFGA